MPVILPCVERKPTIRQKVLERNIEQDDDDDSLEYSLTVQLDDGTAF